MRHHQALSVLSATMIFVQAHALSPSQTMDPATIKLYMAIGESLDISPGTRALCIGGTETLYSAVPDYRQWAVGTGYTATWADLKEQERLGVWSCRIQDTAPQNFAALRGKNVSIFISRDRGLDGTYFDAVAQYDGLPRAPIRFLSPSNTTCTAAPTAVGVVPLYWCSATQLQRPLMGVAEVNPELIQGINVTTDTNNSPAGGYQTHNVGRGYGPMKLYGVAASLPLYREMQGAQGLPTTDGAASRPTASSTDVRSYLSSPSDWGWVLGVNHPRRHEQINWCLPRQGSGVRAVAQRVFLDYPCSSSPLSPVDHTWSDQQQAAQLDSIGTTGGIGVVDDADTERGVEECLATANARGALALGLVSVGRFAETGGLWRMLKLDGIEPHRDQAKTGRYPFVGESMLLWQRDQLRNSSTALQQLVEGYASLLNTPWVWGDPSGVMLQPTSVPFGTGDAASQRMAAASSRTGSMCQPVIHLANLPEATQATMAPTNKQRSAAAAAAASTAPTVPVDEGARQDSPVVLLKVPPLLPAPRQQQ